MVPQIGLSHCRLLTKWKKEIVFFLLLVYASTLTWFCPSMYITLDHSHIDSKTISQVSVLERVQNNNVLNRGRLLDRKLTDTVVQNTTILWISKVRSNLRHMSHMFSNCVYRNCIFTNDTRKKETVSAVVFDTQSEFTASLDPRYKPRNQVWIFLRMEPPPKARYITWYKDPIWTNSMNWSLGYRLDSDIFRPYRTLTTRQMIPEKDYGKIFQRKTKVAAWIVSDCKTQSKREVYVKQLRQFGVPIDVYGRCSSEHKWVDFDILEGAINKDYKFYLSFENSLCKDYVSEKFFKYYNMDVVLVVRGGLNYTQVFDGSSFINTKDFPTAKELADFILKVNFSERLYTNYLRNKDKYEVVYSLEDMVQESFCTLCEKLNHADQYPKVYANISEYIHNKTCASPDDL